MHTTKLSPEQLRIREERFRCNAAAPRRNRHRDDRKGIGRGGRQQSVRRAIAAQA